MPPLLLDDEEAVAVTVGLHTAATAGITGIEEASLRAVTKLEHVLPARLRGRVRALEQAMTTIPPRRDSTVDTAVLTAISTAIHAAETLRFDYIDHHGEPSRRAVEPHRVVCWGPNWYLVGWDVERADWRTFRVDRISPRTPNGPRFAHRRPPDGDVTAYLRRRIGFELWPYHCLFRIQAPASALRGRAQGIVTPIDEHTCLLEIGCDSLDLALLVVGMLDVDFTVESPPEFAARLRLLSTRFAAAAREPDDHPGVDH